jgi:tetratricopeptide (TPR) repeat protein
MSDSINPYITDNPVGDGAGFIGRTDILPETIQILSHAKKNTIVLYGQRCIGKTSVLQYLTAQLPTQGDYYPIYFDLQDKATWDLEQFVNELAKKMADALNQAAPDLGEQPEATFQDTWLPSILQEMPENAALILLFDEFDEFKALEEPKAEQAGAAFFPYVRQLLDSNLQRLNFIFAGGRNIDDLDHFAISLFRGIPPIKRLSLLNKADTIQLVRLSEANNTLKWPDEAVECVWRYTQGHPFFTQQICYQVWAQTHQSKNFSETLPTTTPADVENVVFDVLDASRYRMAWLWEGLPPAERVIASALAEAGPGILTDSALEEKLHESGIHVVIQELKDAPCTLEDWDLLDCSEAGYQFYVELIRRWIKENKPLRRVQAELDRIDPVAEKLFQGATALHKEAQFELSIKQLRETIGLNPNHLGAHQLLADILLAQGQALEAKELLEKLYNYQALTARSRLIQTLLALAQQTNNEAQQLEWYVKVLALEPNQPEATVKSREIWQQRGETALAKKDLKTALAIYKKLGVNKKVAEIEQKVHDHYFDLVKEPSALKKKIYYSLWMLAILVLIFSVWFLGNQWMAQIFQQQLDYISSKNVEHEKQPSQFKLQNSLHERKLEQDTSLEKTLEQVKVKNALLEKTLAQANQKIVQLENTLVKLFPKTDLGGLITQLEKGNQILIVGSYAQRQDAEKQLEKLKLRYSELFEPPLYPQAESVENNIHKVKDIWEISISGSYSYQSALILEKKLLTLDLIESAFVRRKHGEKGNSNAN